MFDQISVSLGRMLLGLLLVLALGVSSAAARTDVFLGFGLGAPVYTPPPYYAYPPPVIYPPPVVYAPPPVIYTPPPVYQQPPQTWYYCDNPAGYYPYVASCNSSWRPVQAQ
jgi:hypothetical protein